MALTEQDFINAVTKIAAEVEDNEDQSVKGEQKPAVPELLQPDAGPGKGPREAFETFTTDAEKRHAENRENGYLPDAFAGFDREAKREGRELSDLFSNFGKDTIVSHATAEAGATKVGSACMAAFVDEFNKIAGSRGYRRLRRVYEGIVKKRGLGSRSDVAWERLTRKAEEGSAREGKKLFTRPRAELARIKEHAGEKGRHAMAGLEARMRREGRRTREVLGIKPRSSYDY